MQRFRFIQVSRMIAYLSFFSPVIAACQGIGEFPNKPVSVVIPFAAGGPTDFEARLYTQKMGEALGKPFVFDYRIGNSGIIGTTFAAKATPDGYTLVPGQGSFTSSAATVRNLSYDPIKDFSPIVLMSKRSMLLVVSPGFPAKSTKDYLAFAKTNPSKINFATLGNGSVFHLAGAWLHGLTNTSVTFVPYKGVAPAITDLIGGRVDVMLVTPETGLPLVKAGKARIIATSASERHPMLLDIPTLSESGVVGYDYGGWYGFFCTSRNASGHCEQTQR